MIKLTLDTPTLSALFALLESLPAGDKNLFRGQSNAAWQLIPSLYRIQPNIVAGSSKENYDLLEEMLLRRFYNEGQPYLPAVDRNYSNDRALAQHFGVPTRLLDWTEDPLVAAYFAVENHDSPTDATIYALLPDGHFMPDAHQDIGPYRAIAFRPPVIDRRILAQRSVFTFHPYGPIDKPFIPLDAREGVGSWVANPGGRGGKERGFTRIVVPQKNKWPLFSRLLQMGIDRKSLFPGLDGVGADIAARAKVGRY